MPIVQDYNDLNQYFHETDRKLILNNFKITDVEPEKMKKLLFTQYEDEISIIPQCECGYFKGAWRLGQTCPKCGTSVVKAFDIIKPLLWIEKFRDDLKFLNPHFWNQLTSILGKRIDGLRWLADTSYNPPKIPTYLHSIKNIIGGRGYLNVINNIEKILLYIANNSVFKSNKKDKKAKRLLEEWKRNRDKLLVDYLPLVNKRLFVMEVTGKDAYTTTMLGDVIDISLLAVKLANMDPYSKKVENGVGKIISGIAKLFIKYSKEKLSGKKGMVRKHIYGTRSHFTFRAVITSLPTSEDYDVLHVPWIIGPTAFRPHIINKLLKRGYTYKEASNLVFEAVNKHYPVIEEILNELIEESPYKGIPVIFNRNPSLLMGSSQLYYITKFKTNIEDKTIGVNMMTIKAPNGDAL